MQRCDLLRVRCRTRHGVHYITQSDKWKHASRKCGLSGSADGVLQASGGFELRCPSGSIGGSKCELVKHWWLCCNFNEEKVSLIIAFWCNQARFEPVQKNDASTAAVRYLHKVIKQFDESQKTKLEKWRHLFIIITQSNSRHRTTIARGSYFGVHYC